MRRVFPDGQITYSLASLYFAFVPPGSVVSVFTDEAGTIPADIRQMDGSSFSMGSPLAVDDYSRVPLFLGPDDGTDTLYVVVSGGLPIAIYARADDRLDALELATVGLNQPDDATALANPTPGVAAFLRLIVATLVNLPGILARGNTSDTVVKNLYEGQDGSGAPIWAIGTAGGEYLNDLFRQHYGLLSNPTVMSSIYGYRAHNGLTEFAWAGPWGNMCSFADACHEVYESTRSGSKGGWQVASGTSSDAASVTDSSLPTTLRHAVELTSHTTSMTALTGSGVFALPVTAGATYTALANVKAVATTRSPQVGMQWWDSGAGFISTTVGTATATTTSAYTLITSGNLTAPVGAAYGAPCIVWPTSVSGEKHRVGGIGVWAGTVAEWAPPFVGSPYGSWGQAALGDIFRRRSTPTDPDGRLAICTTAGIPAAQVWTPMGTARLSSSTPAATSASGSAGSGTSSSKSDHVHASPQLTATVPVALGSVAVGIAIDSARQDHVHPTTGLLLTSNLSSATPQALATAGAAGSGSDTARSDHAHGVGAWTTYTPGFTNVTLGNGTSTGRYMKITPNLMVIVIQIGIGSTTSITGSIGVNLPAGAAGATTVPQRVVASAFDTSADTVFAGAASVTASDLSGMRFHGIASTGAAAVPFTWANGDNLRLWGFVELT